MFASYIYIVYTDHNICSDLGVLVRSAAAHRAQAQDVTHYKANIHQ